MIETSKRLVEDAAYGRPARIVFLDACKLSVSMLMRQADCAEGQQGAVQYYIDLMVRHKVTVKGFLLMRVQVGKEDGILTVVIASPKLRGGADGHG